MASPPSPEQQPVPIAVLPAAPPPAKLAPRRAVVDDHLPTRPCTPPPSSTAHPPILPAEGGSSPQHSPSRFPIPRIPDFEGLVDSGTDSDDELFQLSRVKASSSTVFPAGGSPGPSTPKKSSTAGSASGSVTDSSSLSPLSSLMNRIGSIGRGSPTQATSHCEQTPEAAKSSDNLAVAAHRAEVRRLTHKRMQEELHKNRHPYSSHSYKRSTMSTIKEDATDTSPRGIAAMQQKALSASLGNSPSRRCTEYNVVKSTEDLSMPSVVDRKLKKKGSISLSLEPNSSASSLVLPRAFALQGNARIKLPQGLEVRGRSRNSRSRSLRDWVWSSFAANQPQGGAPVGQELPPTEVSAVSDSQDGPSKASYATDGKGKMGGLGDLGFRHATPSDGICTKPARVAAQRTGTKEMSETTPESLSSLDEDASIHEACKARVVTSGRLSASSVHPLSSDSAVWNTIGADSRQHVNLAPIARHGQESSGASRISTLNLPSPCLEPALASGGESRQILRRTRGSSSHDDSIQLSLPSRYFDYAAALEAADAESAYEGSACHSGQAQAGSMSNPQSLVGDMEKMSEGWHQQISQIQRGSPVKPVSFPEMRLSQTWPSAMQLPSIRKDQSNGSQDPFRANESIFEVAENPARAVDGSLVTHGARRRSHPARHTMALDTRDMDTAWWQDHGNNPTSCDEISFLDRSAKSKLSQEAGSLVQGEVIDIVPESATEPHAERKAEPYALQKPSSSGFENVIRARLKKVLLRKQESVAADSLTPPPGQLSLVDTSTCGQETEKPLENQSTMAEASRSKDDTVLILRDDISEMAAEQSEITSQQDADFPNTPVSRLEPTSQLGPQTAQEKRLTGSPDEGTIKDVDSIFGAWVRIDNSQDTVPATPVKKGENKADGITTPKHGPKPDYSVPSTPVATAYAEVRAYIADAFASPRVSKTVQGVHQESPSSSYKDAVSSHDTAATHPVSNAIQPVPDNAFPLRSDLALPKLPLDADAPSAKFNTWSGRVNPTKPRLMRSTVQFSTELESIFLGKQRECKNKDNTNILRDSMPRAIAGHD
ncbi:c6 zinc finger domain containing protein [Ophiostoma piceae UAMH 11346]|uniref:C6 zinc finger domain containing protein n=1 Tax=Ophiostoma piceae (strain UAMH 11346) TaxID=1262450 RepID=S3CWW7_OPHP1|nr:c6 zinc finger domain containing protein [Ophiostoma piceae UAMH 11346]